MAGDAVMASAGVGANDFLARGLFFLCWTWAMEVVEVMVGAAWRSAVASCSKASSCK